MKEPEYSEAEKCIEIRKRSKRGIPLSPEETKYVTEMFNKYPEWYGKQRARIFNETLPFGSQAYRNND